MPWSAGVFNRANGPTGWQDDAAASIPIAANRHDTQDNDFRDGINNCLAKDGSNIPTANLGMGGYRHTNVAAAVNTTDYARYDQLLGIIPTGLVLAYSGSTTPTGWLVCDGSAVSRTSYGALNLLYSGLSYPYGAGDGSTTFNLPDLRRRFIAGKGASDTLGFTEGGNNTGTAYASRSMSHSHAIPGHYHSSTGAGSNLTAAGQTLSNPTNVGVTGFVGGSDGTHTHAISDPGHTHGMTRRASATAFGNTSAIAFPNTSGTEGTVQSETSVTSISVTSANSGHGHGFSLSANIAHAHAASVVSGSLGKVTGGSNGDASFNSDPTVTGSYLFLNYIVKT
jgi:microcystin-dependent protein